MVVLALRSLASSDNVVYDIPYSPADPKFPTSIGVSSIKLELVNVSYSWDSTRRIECRGPAKARELITYSQNGHYTIFFIANREVIHVWDTFHALFTLFGSK